MKGKRENRYVIKEKRREEKRRREAEKSEERERREEKRREEKRREEKINVMNEHRHREEGQVLWSARTKGCLKPFNWSIINVIYIY